MTHANILSVDVATVWPLFAAFIHFLDTEQRPCPLITDSLQLSLCGGALLWVTCNVLGLGRLHICLFFYLCICQYFYSHFLLSHSTKDVLVCSAALVGW